MTITEQMPGLSLAAQFLDLAEVDVRPFERVVQTRLGPRTEMVRGHVEQENWIPAPKWKAGQQEWVQRGEAAWKGRQAREGGEVAGKAQDYIKGLAGKVKLRELNEYNTAEYEDSRLDPAFRYTPEQRAALDRYSDHSYEMNSLARGEPVEFPRHPRAQVEADTEALSSAMQPMPDDMILLREIKGKDALADLQPGDVIADDAFASTTLRPGRFAAHRDDTTVLHILTPKGTPVAWVGRAEDEILLDRGTPMVVISKSPGQGRFANYTTDINLLVLPKDVQLASLHRESVLLAAARRKDGAPVATLTDRMHDFRPRKIGHVDLAPQAPISLAAQLLDLADPGTIPGRDGGPVPDDKTAVSMFTAHRLDGTLRELAHATQRMHAARAATGDLRAYHSRHVRYHLARALQAGHELTANLRAHYPAEAAELEQVKQAVGLAKSLTAGLKAATTAHLLETTLHEETHGVRHAEPMGDTEPDDVWDFNADHCEKHLGGAVEHASKLAHHFADNYPEVARWLDGLGEITAGAEEKDGRQHARYAKGGAHGTVSAQMADPGTISAQVDLAEVDVRPFQRVVQTRLGPRTEMVRGHVEQHQGWIPQAKWQAGQQEWEQRGQAARAAAEAREPAAPAGLPWQQDGDVMAYHGSLGVDRADMPQVSGTLADGRYAPSSEMIPKFLDHLKQKGVDVTHERVPARSLKPTQTTGDMRAVRGIAGSLASGDLKDTKPVLVSSDNRVVDGHHQWAAHVLGAAKGTRTGTAPGEPVIRAGMPADKLMAEARQFAKDQGIRNRKTGVAANPKFARPGLKSVSQQAAPADSLAKHTQAGGTFTPERAALHQRIIGEILAGHQPQEHPVATFFGGGPASGKSTALTSTHPDSALIDADAIKARLPEYQQMLDAKDPRAAAYVHEESSHVSKQAVKEAQKRRLNFTWDGTGDSDIAKLAGKVNDARNAGYLTEGKYVTVGTDEAVRRAQARAQATGRHVPEEFIRQTHAAVSDTYGKAAKMGLYDKTELWDTSGKSPKLVAHKQPGGKFTVADQAAWQAFLAKAGEGQP